MRYALAVRNDYLCCRAASLGCFPWNTALLGGAFFTCCWNTLLEHTYVFHLPTLGAMPGASSFMPSLPHYTELHWEQTFWSVLPVCLAVPCRWCLGAACCCATFAAVPCLPLQSRLFPTTQLLFILGCSHMRNIPPYPTLPSAYPCLGACFLFFALEDAWNVPHLLLLREVRYHYFVPHLLRYDRFPFPYRVERGACTVAIHLRWFALFALLGAMELLCLPWFAHGALLPSVHGQRRFLFYAVLPMPCLSGCSHCHGTLPYTTGAAWTRVFRPYFPTLLDMVCCACFKRLNALRTLRGRVSAYLYLSSRFWSIPWFLHMLVLPTVQRHAGYAVPTGFDLFGLFCYGYYSSLLIALPFSLPGMQVLWVYLVFTSFSLPMLQTCLFLLCSMGST